MSKNNELKSIQEQIAALKAKEQELINKERASVIATIRETIADYGLTEADLFGRIKAKTPKVKLVYYYDSVTKTKWGGKGKKPPFFDGMAKDVLQKYKLPSPVPADTLE
jgi:DNA-binding protein H-NS